jgi:hypothetical protein
MQPLYIELSRSLFACDSDHLLFESNEVRALGAFAIGAAVAYRGQLPLSKREAKLKLHD